MALIVETGLNVPGANSYVDLADCRTYASDRGLTVNADDTILTQQLILATNYLEGYRSQYQGIKTYEDQPLQFPRCVVYIDGILLDENTIPKELKDAQCQLAVDQESGIELFPTQTGKYVTEEQVGPLKTKYSSDINTSGQPCLPLVSKYIDPLLKSGAFGDVRSSLRI